ncbi:hypothetical protein ACIQFU_08425 [Streptomyces sp. NPDC093065]|uniref:hypothetical protein n=1 Tax=Streptomyces sp. NPDC093065 TaxID=3366021 RepID=UPI0038250A4D
MEGRRTAAEHASALLRRRLEDAVAGTGLSRTQLIARSGLARTTVYDALRRNGPVPSAHTVAALAQALKLPVGELLELRRAAELVGASREDEPGPGRPLSTWDPHDLEVHPAGVVPAGDAGCAQGRRKLPGYVFRPHDQVLAEAVRDAASGRSRMVVLVGTSSTGKTRACWEAVQSLAASGWRLWHPFDPGRVEAALGELHLVRPRTVVWLNEAQHYLGDPVHGERVAAAVHGLLSAPERAPILVLGTLWPEYADRYTALPAPRAPDPHSRVRELLTADRRVAVPDAFDDSALAAAEALAEAGDALLVDALPRVAGHGRVAQDLAGAPELLRRYEDGSPGARALLDAAMDARRLGVGPGLPQSFLTDAAVGYLSEADFQQLGEDWVEVAYAELARPVHGKQAPLRRVRHRPAHRPPHASPQTDPPHAPTAGPEFRLADYLEQHGRAVRRTACPPASFWHSAHAHLGRADELTSLGQAAQARHRLEWAYHLYRHAAANRPLALLLSDIAEWREQAGDRQGAETLARRAAELGAPGALLALAGRRERAGDLDAAESLAREAHHAGSVSALERLAGLRERAGDRAGATGFACRAADASLFTAVARLASTRRHGADVEGAEVLLRKAARTGVPFALLELAESRERAGDKESAEDLARRAAAFGDVSVLSRLAELRERDGHPEQAEALLRQAAGDHPAAGAVRLAELRESAGDLDGAEALLRRAADAGDIRALSRLVLMLEERDQPRAAEDLALRAAAAGDPEATVRLTHQRERAGDREGADTLARWAAAAGASDAADWLAGLRRRSGEVGTHHAPQRASRTGEDAVSPSPSVPRTDVTSAEDPYVLVGLAQAEEDAGHGARAEELIRQAAGMGLSIALVWLADWRAGAGDREGAEALLGDAANAGASLSPLATSLWPHGLDADGTPSAPWL